MDLLCKWCGETKEDVQFLKRKSDEPYSQANVRCCKRCNAAKNRERYSRLDVREKQLRANSQWRRNNRSKMRKFERDFHERKPDRQGARNRVRHLVRHGYWTRQPCCICGAEQRVEAHHDSYAEPHWETVRWLCKDHHERWHSVLDPVRNGLIEERLAEAEMARDQAKDLMTQINEMRARYRELTEKAKRIELDAWSDVQKAAEPMFEEFRRQAAR